MSNTDVKLWQEYYLSVEQRSIKVEIRDLIKLFEEFEKQKENADNESNTGSKDFITYFEKKYLELTSLRVQEKAAYEYYKKVREIAKREEYGKVKEFEISYNRIRNKRIKLQAEIEKEKTKYYFY